MQLGQSPCPRLQAPASISRAKEKVEDRMDSGQIRTDTNSDTTIYHILNQILEYEYKYYRILMQNGHVESGFEFRYLLDFEDKMYLFVY